jgi:hypothetical protein
MIVEIPETLEVTDAVPEGTEAPIKLMEAPELELVEELPKEPVSDGVATRRACQRWISGKRWFWVG